MQLGECSLSFLHTRGHANHHTCVVDRDFGGVFSGDSFGIAYPANAVDGEFDGSRHTAGERFMFPGTAPADYDTEEAIKAVDNVRVAVLARLRCGVVPGLLTSRRAVEATRVRRSRPKQTVCTCPTTGRGTTFLRVSAACIVASVRWRA